MTKPTLGKKGLTSPESMNPSKSGTGKKNWQTPELTEVDYEKTNTGYSGGGSDLGFYS
jgi:hypothetical protein